MDSNRQDSIRQKTVVRVDGKEYALVSDRSAEYMQRVAAYVDRQLAEMKAATHLPANMVAMLTTLNIADELFMSQAENSRLRRQAEELKAKWETKEHATEV